MKQLLITGASGFLGSELAQGLSLAYDISKLGRSDSDDIHQDITIPFELNTKYDCVIHAAGKAHSIPKNQSESQAFLKVNLDGTKNLLKALEANPPSKFVFISSVAVYGMDSGQMIDESESLNPQTPYAESKVLAENEGVSWCLQNKCEYYILRLPLIAGTNPPGNLKSLQHAIKKGYYFRIGSGEARKSMVGTADIIGLIPKLEARSGIYNLSDGVNPTIAEIDTFLAKSMNRRIRQFPEYLIRLVALVGDCFPRFPLNTMKYKKLSAELTFSDQKAREILGWNPEPALNSLKFVIN